VARPQRFEGLTLMAVEARDPTALEGPDEADVEPVGQWLQRGGSCWQDPSGRQGWCHGRIRQEALQCVHGGSRLMQSHRHPSQSVHPFEYAAVYQPHQAFDRLVVGCLGSDAMTGLVRGSRERRAAGVVFGLFVAGGLLVLFAGTLARATELEREAAQARAEIAALEARLESGRAEVEFMGSDAFVEQRARAEGYGARAEVPFRLPEDAPSPPPLESLGADEETPRAGSAFDAWMTLLFGA
jgi:cell division protein FtsB